MANFLVNRKDTVISIPEVGKVEKYTVYCIRVEIGNVHWVVKHRYSSFAELHELLVSDHGVAKDLLPPKKVIGNLDPSFIEKRRVALETYLKNVVNFLQRAMPRELAHFLLFQHYDILSMLQNLALQCFVEGDALLQDSKTFKFTPLQLHAISERLKQPCPPINHLDKRLDFSHVLDFCCQLTSVHVEGSNFFLDSSNLVPNQLPYDLLAFKSMRALVLTDVSMSSLCDAQVLRASLLFFTVRHSQLRSIAAVVLCDALHKDADASGDAYRWTNLEELDLSFNYLEDIDAAITLMPNLKKLVLNHNKLSSIQNLTSLSRLSHLSLSANSFYSLPELHLKLGNVVHLDLSENRLASLASFSRLYSLEHLDLASNTVCDVAEVRHLASLPCLEYLVLTGNPVATVVDYRTRVLERFGSRSAEICLDNERPSQKEIDTIAVLQALRIVQEGRNQSI